MAKKTVLRVTIKRELSMAQASELANELEGYAQEYMEQEWDEKKSEK